MRGLCCVLLWLLAATAARAENLLIDTSQSRAAFSLRALWVKRIDGDFGQVEGVIERDPVSGRFGVDVRIAAESLRMPKPDHAAWARSDDFFDAGRHPWIRFRAVDVPERVLHEGGTVRGELTLRGFTHAVDFEVAPAECPRPGLDCAVRAQGEVRRSLFGMTARRFVLGDRVQIEFAIRSHPSAPPQTAG